MDGSTNNCHLIVLGYPIKAINNSTSKVAFAASPFLFFLKLAYDSIGGLQAVAQEVVEDLALAKKIKSSGFNLRFLLGLDEIEVRMYSNFENLWEGWTKNWFIGLDRNIIK